MRRAATSPRHPAARTRNDSSTVHGGPAMPDTGGSTAIDNFNPDNRAWRRFTTVAGEHFDVGDWTREDGRPVRVSLTDLDSGDVLTLAILDSLENRDPYALLVLTADGAMAAY